VVEHPNFTMGEFRPCFRIIDAELKTTVAQQQKQIEALTATVQKVSDQIALSKPNPQLVTNP
jgi:hypothetical protein